MAKKDNKKDVQEVSEALFQMKIRDITCGPQFLSSKFAQV